MRLSRKMTVETENVDAAILRDCKSKLNRNPHLFPCRISGAAGTWARASYTSHMPFRIQPSMTSPHAGRRDRSRWWPGH